LQNVCFWWQITSSRNIILMEYYLKFAVHVFVVQDKV
jgi:hypothetical protein